MALRRGVLVDVQVIREWASRQIQGELNLAFFPSAIDALKLCPAAATTGCLMERVRQQLLQHALKGAQSRARARPLVRPGGRGGDRRTTCASAQRVLVAVHLAEGNRVEARRAFDG
jgi:hypothetical protein